MSLWFSQIQESQNQIRERYINDLRKLHLDISLTIEISFSELDKLLEIFSPDVKSCFILGKGKGESVAREGALKIKEVSYIHAEGYSSSSLKHGPFALLDKIY